MTNNKTIAFNTLGCKVNFYDTEAVWELFEAKGYKRVDFKEQADVYIINTCTVTNSGDQKSRQIIRRAIRNNPDAVVAVMGCYTQTNPDDILKIDGVDIVIGTSGREKLVDMVESYLEERKPQEYVLEYEQLNKYESLTVSGYKDRTRANIKVQEGCNNFCSFCIIPYARGQMRSRDPKDVIENVQTLVNSGHKEIILTGIHTGGYGVDFDNYRLLDLIKDIEKQVDGIKRLRISSIEATQVTDDLIEYIKESKILARHLHIPMQSGSKTVLERMNRKYTLDEFISKLQHIRNEIPDISLTSDVIVGFPGEIEEEFMETKQSIVKCGFNELHVFPYSIRNGTPAAEMKDQIPSIVKTMRVNELINLSKQQAMNYAKQFFNRDIKMIVEESKDGYLLGHSNNYLKIKVQGDESLIGSEIDVKITEAGYPISKAIIN